MTYDAREKSIQDGEPIELYTFALGSRTWRYTSADRLVTVAANDFEPKALTRTDIESTSDRARLGIKIRAPRTLEVVKLFLMSPPSQAVTLVLQQYHEGDGEVSTIWTGRILGVDFASGEISLEPVYTSVRRLGLRRLYQVTCTHSLYGTKCKADKDAHSLAGTAGTISGVSLNVPEAAAAAASFYAGGYVEYQVEGVTERRFIAGSTGGDMTLFSAPYGLSPGAAVTIYPGCDHNPDTCDSKFGNIPHFGGFPYFPKKNPFSGQPVF